MSTYFLPPLQGGFLGGASSQLSALGRSNSGLNTGLRINIQSKQEDAARITLAQSGRRGLTGQSQIQEASKTLEEAQNSSYVKGFFSQLTSITSDLRSLSEELAKAQPGTEQATQLQQQYDSLTNDYARIVGSSDFQHLLEINKQVLGILQGGTRPEDLYRALQPESGFLGSDYLNRVRFGDTAQLSKFSENIIKLGAITAQDFLTNPGTLDLIDSAVNEATQSLAGPAFVAQESSETKKKVVAVAKEPPKLASVSFGSNQGLSIQLNTYIGTDAIQAALAHMPLDPKNVIRLVFDHDGEKEKDKYKEHEEKKKIEQLGRSKIQDPTDSNENRPLSELEPTQSELNTTHE